MKRYSARRIEELDYLKAVMIILMVVFHLVYIGDHYVYAKQVVYTFHMPVFLVISGYLMNMSKPVPAFLRTMLWIAVPYLVMESAYVAMASVLPIREHIDVLTPAVFADKLLLHPIGPYWYLHTMLICGTVAYAVRHVAGRNVLSTVMVASLPLYILAEYAGVLSTSNALYYQTVAELGADFIETADTNVYRALQDGGFHPVYVDGRMQYRTMNRECFYKYQNNIFDHHCDRRCLSDQQWLVAENGEFRMSVDGHVLGKTYLYDSDPEILQKAQDIFLYAKDLDDATGRLGSF